MGTDGSSYPCAARQRMTHMPASAAAVARTIERGGGVAHAAPRPATTSQNTAWQRVADPNGIATPLTEPGTDGLGSTDPTGLRSRTVCTRSRVVFHVHGFNPLPDCLRRALEAECPDIRLKGARTDQGADAVLGTEGGEATVRAVLVDESVVERDPAVLVRLSERLPDAARVVLVRSAANVDRMNPAARQACAEVGVVPMDLPLETWLLALRLAMTGFVTARSDAHLARLEGAPHRSGVPLMLDESVVPPIEPTLPQMVHAGAPAEAADTAPEPSAASPRAVAQALTPREHEVMERIASGKPNKIIADDLGISEHTVKLHVHHILSKLGATNRTEAAARYLASRHDAAHGSGGEAS